MLACAALRFRAGREQVGKPCWARRDGGPRPCLPALSQLYSEGKPSLACPCACCPIPAPAVQDRHNEIQEVLGQSYALPDDLDETDLMAELDQLEDELGAEAVGSGSVPAYLQARGGVDIGVGVLVGGAGRMAEGGWG